MQIPSCFLPSVLSFWERENPRNPVPALGPAPGDIVGPPFLVANVSRDLPRRNYFIAPGSGACVYFEKKDNTAPDLYDLPSRVDGLVQLGPPRVRLTAYFS